MVVGNDEINQNFSNKPFVQLPVEQLQPLADQPRKHFLQDELEDLAASIRDKGVLQPIIARPLGENLFEIVAGERRWRAAQIAGLEEVPAIVYNLSKSEALEIALIENLQRSQLSPIEEAKAFESLISKYGHTQESLATKIGKSRSYIANAVRLLNLDESVIGLLESNKITAGHARALLTARNPKGLAEKVVAEQLSVRQAENLSKNDAQRVMPYQDIELHCAELATKVTEKTGLHCEISFNSNKGKVCIHYNNLEQLDGFIRKVT